MLTIPHSYTTRLWTFGFGMKLAQDLGRYLLARYPKEVHDPFLRLKPQCSSQKLQKWSRKHEYLFELCGV